MNLQKKKKKSNMCMIWNKKEIELINWKSDADCIMKDLTLVKDGRILISISNYYGWNQINLNFNKLKIKLSI
jgi:hypothetical protein